MAGRLKDKVAIVTGAASGIGRETVLRFVQEGAKVVAADRNRAGGMETVNAWHGSWAPMLCTRPWTYPRRMKSGIW